MTWRTYSIVIIVVATISASLLLGDIVPEGRKPLTYCEYINGKTYGVMLHVNFDEAGSYLARRIKEGLDQYTSVRIEAKYKNTWRVGEYTFEDFVERLDLRNEPTPTFCCRKFKDAQVGSAWEFCPFCQTEIPKETD